MSAQSVEPAAAPESGPDESEEEPTSISVSLLNSSTIKTRYVSVYNPETGQSAVYDLKELLVEPEETLVTQEECAEQLEELGFHSTLSTRVAPAEEQANGLGLMFLISAGMASLLWMMARIRKNRFDESAKESR